MIDTHAHLDFEDFENDIEDVIKNAKNEGVEYILNIGTTIEKSMQSIELAEKYDFIYSSVGIHPHDAGNITENIEETLEIIKALALKDKVVAIGEVGLDYYRDISPREIQRQWLSRFIMLSDELDKPLILHNREADKDIIDIIKSEKKSDNKGVFHCFSSDKDVAKMVLDMGFCISFNGILTFPNATKVREVAKYVPQDMILVETDCPFLAPQQHRGKRNEPAYVKYVTSKLAQIKQMSFEDIDRIITRNALRLFRI